MNVMKPPTERIGQGCGVIAAVMLLAVVAAFAARFGWYAAERLLMP